MLNVVGGNTNAACIMIGEKPAEMIATDHGVMLHELVGGLIVVALRFLVSGGVRQADGLSIKGGDTPVRIAHLEAHGGGGHVTGLAVGDRHIPLH